MKNSILISAALAGILAGGACKEAPKAQVSDEGKCYGVNSCKGTGSCASKEHGCAGLNTCKGKAWLKMKSKECADKSGKFEPVEDGKYM
ncbi:MAG TPA: hypothetical protein PKX74_11990 [Leptospiraceae bacterium]|jgi:hypothetical protein|nr:hypothetical protein [Leptospiraceae bacterium]HMZ37537.1 hypothetical protein [Leptospiraceae bacterium]HNJ32716.1 hypothetical protein [Leptospiraceae bacterium]HNN60276.1 hypothetical protein [Leptospiraceae bacterium]HNN75367.1 hypothetical protein [Leptospiraceae bacterium]